MLKDIVNVDIRRTSLGEFLDEHGAPRMDPRMIELIDRYIQLVAAQLEADLIAEFNRHSHAPDPAGVAAPPPGAGFTPPKAPAKPPDEKPKKCPECNGRGHFEFPMSTPVCDTCKGTGTLPVTRRGFDLGNGIKGEVLF